MTYSMTCSCGDVMDVEADSHEEAVEQLEGYMTADAVAAHFAEKHPGEEVPSVEEVHANIAASVQPVPAAA